MSILASAITASPEELQANRVAYEARVADLRARRTAALAAGSAAARQQLRDGGQIWRFVCRLLPRPARVPTARAGHYAWHTLVSYVRATRATVQPRSTTGVENAKPGGDGITTENASSLRPPCATGSVSGRIMSR